MNNRPLFQCVRSISLILVLSLFAATAHSTDRLPVPGIPYAPRHYVCYHTSQPLSIDGHLDESPWQNAEWIELFTDIEGSLKPAPRFETRAKLLWDSVYLYIGADLQEPDVWATLTQRDAVIYHDNDFEVFIDPDMDTHEYYELEVNALNTIWDLLLLKSYRDGGPAVNAWDIQGLKTAVAVKGTINRPGDTDTGWSLEIAIPWAVLAECAHRVSPPKDGDQWKINFSRVEWHAEAKNGAYVKVLDPNTGKSLPEDNWVWSPQGLIAMHYPEMWGIVQFSAVECGTRKVDYVPDPVDPARWALRRLYYAERDYFSVKGRYIGVVPDLKPESPGLADLVWPPVIEVTSTSFTAQLESRDHKVRLLIREDGRLWQINQ